MPRRNARSVARRQAERIIVPRPNKRPPLHQTLVPERLAEPRVSEGIAASSAWNLAGSASILTSW
jgi:hypothetical protein